MKSESPPQGNDQHLAGNSPRQYSPKPQSSSPWHSSGVHPSPQMHRPGQPWCPSDGLQSSPTTSSQPYAVGHRSSSPTVHDNDTQTGSARNRSQMASSPHPSSGHGTGWPPVPQSLRRSHPGRKHRARGPKARRQERRCDDDTVSRVWIQLNQFASQRFNTRHKRAERVTVHQ